MVDSPTKSDRDVMRQEYDADLSDTKYILTDPFLRGANNIYGQTSSRLLQDPFLGFKFTPTNPKPRVSPREKPKVVDNTIDTWQSDVKLEPLSEVVPVLPVTQESTCYPNINQNVPQIGIQNIQSCSKTCICPVTNTHLVSCKNDIVRLSEKSAEKLAHNTPQSLSVTTVTPPGRVSELIAGTSRTETIVVETGVTSTNYARENGVVTTRIENGPRPKRHSAIKAAAKIQQASREEEDCDPGLSQHSSTEDLDYEGFDLTSSNDDLDASVESNSEIPLQFGVKRQSSKRRDVLRSRLPADQNYNVSHIPSQNNPVGAEQRTGEAFQGLYLPSHYFVNPGNVAMNNIPHINPNMPQRYQTVPQIYQTVPQIYQTVPQRYQTVPQRYQNIPHTYHNVPHRFQTVPLRYQTVPQRYQTVPQRYHNAPQRYQTEPQRYQTVPKRYQTKPQRQQNAPQRPPNAPQNIGGPCIPSQNLIHARPRLIQNEPHFMAEPRQPVNRVRYKNKAPKIRQKMLKNKGNVTVHKCNICTKEYSKEQDLKYHQMYLHQKKFEPKKYPCDICKHKFCLKGTMLMHKRIVHSRDRTSVCEICGQVFDHESKLFIHLKNHKRRFICDICNTYWSTIYNLKTHMLSHTGEKPHKCEVCQQAFSRIDNLKLHLKLMHKDVPRYECKKCNKKFKTNKEKLEHGRKDHPATVTLGLQLTECKLCGIKLANRRHGTHERFHREGKIMKCEQCDEYVKLTNNRYKYDIPGKENKQMTVCHGCFEEYANGFTPEHYKLLRFRCKIKKRRG